MEAVPQKNYCPLPEEKKPARLTPSPLNDPPKLDEEEVKKPTLILLFVVVFLLLVSAVLGFFILQKQGSNNVATTPQPTQEAAKVTPTVVMVTLTTAPVPGEPTAIKTELENMKVEDFETELGSLSQEINQL